MSFASDIKAELCRADIGSRFCAVAECYGILLYCNTFTVDEIKIITSSREFAERLPKLFQKAFGVRFDRLPDMSETGKLVFTMSSPEKTGKILETFGYSAAGVLALHINFGILEDEETRESFMRGVFLAGGSVTDPEKRYHLELVTDHYMVSRETMALLQDMGFEPKSVARSGNYITYFKQSAAIEDFLTTIGAPIGAMNIMSAKIEKDMMNSVNRKVNCDTANVAKTVEASAAQMEAIKKLRESGRMNSLPEKLRETAKLREEYPEMSLAELALECDPPVTKSCLGHRMRKLMQIANENT